MTMSWSDERIDRLKELWKKGMTASQIADELGGVSRNAVIGKAHRLGLQSRPSPVKPNEAEAAPPKAKPAPAPREQESRREETQPSPARADTAPEPKSTQQAAPPHPAATQ